MRMLIYPFWSLSLLLPLPFSSHLSPLLLLPRNNQTAPSTLPSLPHTIKSYLNMQEPDIAMQAEQPERLLKTKATARSRSETKEKQRAKPESIEN